MEGISTWSTVENQMLTLYMTLAGGAAADAAAVFMSIESDGARRSAIAALADLRMSTEQKRVFAAVLKHLATIRTARNRLAHWIWGVCAELPDTLLLGDPKVLVPLTGVRNEADFVRMNAEFDTHILVYKEPDFRTIIKNNERAAYIAMKFNMVMKGHPADANGELLRSISVEPEIANILNRRNPAPKTHPEESP